MRAALLALLAWLAVCATASAQADPAAPDPVTPMARIRVGVSRLGSAAVLPVNVQARGEDGTVFVDLVLPGHGSDTEAAHDEIELETPLLPLNIAVFTDQGEQASVPFTPSRIDEYQSVAIAIGTPAPLPEPEPERFEPPIEPQEMDTCDPYAPDEPVLPFLRVGLDLLLGTQWNEPAVDHGAVGLAIGLDVPIVEPLLIGARASYVTGGDEGVDGDGDFEDDVDSDNLHSLIATAGPRLRLGSNDHYWGLAALEIAVGAGAIASLGGGGSPGPALEGGIRLLRGPTHLGIAVTKGLGDAADFATVMVAAGIDIGGVPEPSFVPNGCNEAPEPGGPPTPFGFRAELVLLSAALHERGGVGPPGLAFVGTLPLTTWLDLVARTDAAYYPGYPGDGLVSYAGVLGLRVQPIPRAARAFFFGVASGYAVSFGTQPRAFEDGPVVDIDASYELNEPNDQGGFYAGVRARFGVIDANEDLRALFVTLGVELYAASLGAGSAASLGVGSAAPP